MYQPLIIFCPHSAIFTQVLAIFEVNLEDNSALAVKIIQTSLMFLARLLLSLRYLRIINTKR